MEQTRGEKLFHAAQTGDVVNLEHLLDGALKSDIEWKHDGCFSNTPLLIAARNGHDSCVNLLIRAGADVNCRDEDGCTILHSYLSRTCNHKCISIALLSALLDAVEHHIDVQDPLYGQTPLMIAVTNGHTEAVKFLLYRGANRTLRDKFGYSSISIAKREPWEIVANRKPWENIEIVLIEDELDEIRRSPAVMALAQVLPDVLADICGDYIYFTKERRRLFLFK